MKRVIWLALMVASPLAMATEGTPQQESGVETKLDRDFRMVDANNDGALSREETEQVKAKLLIANFDKIDTDKNNSLDRLEIKSFLQESFHKTMKAQMEEFNKRLKAADKNKNGKLTKKELKNAKDMPPSLESKFDAIDADGDKQITMEEILAFDRANQPQ